MPEGRAIFLRFLAAGLDRTLGFQCITGDQSPGFRAPVIYFSGFSAAQKSKMHNAAAFS
jgi:hypothetical protein